MVLNRNRSPCYCCCSYAERVRRSPWSNLCSVLVKSQLILVILIFWYYLGVYPWVISQEDPKILFLTSSIDTKGGIFISRIPKATTLPQGAEYPYSIVERRMMIVKGLPEDGPPSPPRSNNGDPSCDLQDIAINDSSLLYPVSKSVFDSEGHLTSYHLPAYDSPDTMNEHPNSQLMQYQSPEYNPDMESSMDNHLQNAQDVPEPVMRIF